MSFEAATEQDKEEGKVAAAFLGIIASSLRLQRDNGMEPTLICINANYYRLLCRFMDSNTLEQIFGIPLEVTTFESMPYIIQGRQQQHG